MDPYRILNTSKTATADEIKNSYRKLAKKFHPDLNPGNKEAEKKFKEINQAYELVGTAETRAKFDRGEVDGQGNTTGPGSGPGPGGNPYYTHTQQNGGRYTQGFGAGGDFNEDIFESIFGQMNGGRGGARASMDRSGEDALYRMTVDFKDAALGAEKDLSLPNGKRLQVKIPAGIDTGARLRFRGQGGQGVGKGAMGDAYVEISVIPSKFFKRDGKNIEIELPISLSEAVLGGEIQVPTLDGAVLMKVPSGVSTGSRLRIRGKGIGSGTDRGDQFAVLKIAMPPQVDSDLADAIRNWSEKHPYNPRESLDRGER